MRAHPRSRGENDEAGKPVTDDDGSSPLTRGKQPVGDVFGVSGGLIPAHAGKTGVCHSSTWQRWAHPRSRGENMARLRFAAVICGSSPLTRGKQEARTGREILCGLIPAHAGKTRQAPRADRASTAHPRSRGENISPGTNTFMVGGSSPLTRGKRIRRWSSSGLPRLIPAHAGKTSRLSAAPQACRAHPRSRGENQMTYGIDLTEVGSSPLTRGKPRFSGRAELRPRLIPAHAGKTRSRQPFCSGLGAHPRSRGENPRRGRCHREADGAHPRSRGEN